MKPVSKIRLKFAGVLFLGLVTGIIAYPRLISFFPAGQAYLERTFTITEGLDLQGGIHLEYRADTSQLPENKKSEALDAVHSVIERRVNAFGVAEPLVQLSRSGSVDRIIVELPGIKNIDEAKQMIKETPFLEFREPAGEEIQKEFDAVNAEKRKQAEAALLQLKTNPLQFEQLAKEMSEDPGSKEKAGDLGFVKEGAFVPEFNAVIFDESFFSGTIHPALVESQFGWHIIKKIEERGEGENREVHAAHILFLKQSVAQYPELAFVATGLSGKHLKNASVTYQNQGIGTPQVSLEFDEEGTRLFAEITKRNVGKGVAIVLDGLPITDTNGDGTIDQYDPPYAPTIQSEILGGQAVITGNYTIQEASYLVKRLNEGALPVPITLERQFSVDASLVDSALKQSLFAGLVGLGAVAVFMILFYRTLGLVAVAALLLYTAMLITLFKLSTFTPFSITLTLSGIAGFILSIGIAVDANVLIYERTREELSYGKSVLKALDAGFRRAWPSIRDGHVSTLITTLILIAMGTGFVKGFAVILALGVLLSLFTAVVLVRITTQFMAGDWMERHPKFLVAPKKPLE